MRCRLLVPALAVPMLGSTASAQDFGFLSEVFKKVHGLSVYFEAAHVRSSSELSMAGSRCKVLGLCGAGAEIYLDLTPPVEGRTHFELGFGASYLRSLSAEEPSLDLRGAIRSFPTFGVYATGGQLPFLPRALKPHARALRPYLGLTFGISDLWNAQAYDTLGKAYSLKAQTFDYGLTAGLAHDEGLFVEVAYRSSRFASIDFGSTETLPGIWPRQLDATGVRLALGWQFSLHEEQEPPAFEGTWVLTKVDGQPLPGVVRQEPPPAGEGAASVMKSPPASWCSVRVSPAATCWTSGGGG